MKLSVCVFSLCLFAVPVLAEGIAPADRRSGFDTMGAQTQGMQRDDTLNPAMLWVAEGKRLWTAEPGTGKAACSGCHGDAETTMRGVSTRYPQINEKSGTPIDLAGRINNCRTERQAVLPLERESRPLLALTSYVGLQSRGMPLASSADPKLKPFRDAGKALFDARIGQLSLSCAQCHDDNWSKRLGGSTIPQGHANGYPLYRLEWQGVGSLQRRIRNCMTGVRAQPFTYGDPELINLELYLNERALGLIVETPAVRP